MAHTPVFTARVVGTFQSSEGTLDSAARRLATVQWRNAMCAAGYVFVEETELQLYGGVEVKIVMELPT